MSALRLSIAALAAGVVAVAGCGEDDNNDTGGASTGAEQSAPAGGATGGTVKLAESEFKITPSDPSVKAGTVTFVVSNKGKIVHALEVEGPGEEKETPKINPGESATLKVDLGKRGTYEFYCPIGSHKQQGMEGEIKVAGGGGGSSDKSDDDSGDKSGGGGNYGY